ncbi:hypothetical protein MKW92_002129 [Papaver armeniacum]|nr:hypothetical protein MKW92_002129 [Papaver armeniacum]
MASSSSPEVSERRGIPGASFVSDFQTYLTQPCLDVTAFLAFLQQRLQQYKVIEMKLLAQQRELQEPIANFEVSEGIYIHGPPIEELDSICLWLGANVMLETEGKRSVNLDNAKASLEVLTNDLQFSRDQVTILQAHLYPILYVHQGRSKQVTASAVKDS